MIILAFLAGMIIGGVAGINSTFRALRYRKMVIMKHSDWIYMARKTFAPSYMGSKHFYDCRRSSPKQLSLPAI